ncbi:hypothetical protein BH23ACT10_BH23ACT10_15300 [soil metagenome]
MANLTLTVDDHLLKRARMVALRRNTSVNAAVREFLERFSGENESAAALSDFLEDARSSTASSGDGRTWRRGDLYEHRDGHA